MLQVCKGREREGGEGSGEPLSGRVFHHPQGEGTNFVNAAATMEAIVWSLGCYLFIPCNRWDALQWLPGLRSFRYVLAG